MTATGIPAGEECQIWVESRTGARELAGSWLVSAQGAQNGTILNGSAIVPLADVSGVTIENTAALTSSQSRCDSASVHTEPACSIIPERPIA